MSVGNSAGISFGGLSSGIDTESIIQRLMQLQQRGITTIENRKAGVKQKIDLYGQLKTQVQTLRSAMGTLNNATNFSGVKATSSTTDVATVSGTSGASAGIYNLSVFRLAQSQKLSSVAQQDLTTALGVSGTINVNGTDVTIASGDNLSQVADKINNSNSGVVASIINGGSGRAFLTLTAKESGATNNIRLKDVSGSVLSTLGFTGASVRDAITNGARTLAADSPNDKLSKLATFGFTGPTNVSINGQTISVDPANDTLSTLATKINGLSGVSANVVTTTEMGRQVSRLEITGSGGTPTFGTEQNFFVDLGLMKRTSELTNAQDAMFSLDGVALRSSTNTNSTALPGATITMLQADAGGAKTSTLTLSRDNDAIKKNIRQFVDAYNSVNSFIADASKFDKDTFASGPLFSDATARQVQGDLASLVLSGLSGLTTQYKNLSQVGVTIADGGKLNINEATLDTALSTDPTGVQALFRTVGNTTGSGLTFVSSTSKTKAASGATLNVSITQIATKSTATGAVMSGTLSIPETLTFKGGPFGTTGVSITLSAGGSISDVITAINSDSRLKDLVVASNDGGKLKFESTRYGTPGHFTVESSIAAGAGTTGIGTSGQTASVNGLDVAGTINGEAATGSGQFLTGTDSNSTTAGLQLQYTGASIGTIGTVSITKGIASLFSERIDGYMDSANGLFAASTNALQATSDDFDKSIEQLQSRLSTQEALLRQRFARMESAMQAAQAQSQRFQAMIGR